MITPELFEAVYRSLPDGDARLLVELAIESGLRWGELTELRPRDIDVLTRILAVSRAVVEVRPAFHPDGGRFLVKDYPKDREHRRFKLSSSIIGSVTDHIRSRGLGPDDLLISMPAPGPRHIKIAPSPAELGLTEPTASGRRYQHGTVVAYTSGRCRCRPCKDAIAIYRAARRAAGHDNRTSRHGAPTRSRHRTPSSSCRRLHVGRRPGRFPVGSSGSRISHCRSVRSLRAPMDSLGIEVSE